VNMARKVVTSLMIDAERLSRFTYAAAERATAATTRIPRSHSKKKNLQSSASFARSLARFVRTPCSTRWRTGVAQSSSASARRPYFSSLVLISAKSSIVYARVGEQPGAARLPGAGVGACLCCLSPSVLCFLEKYFNRIRTPFWKCVAHIAFAVTKNNRCAMLFVHSEGSARTRRKEVARRARFSCLAR
jgi:hypothetical protein